MLGTWEIIAICAVVVPAVAITLIVVLTRQRRPMQHVGNYPYNPYAGPQWPPSAPPTSAGPHAPSPDGNVQEPDGNHPRL